MKGWTIAPLYELATLNPRFSRNGVGPNELVSFVPMAGVSAERASITAVEERRYAEVSKGYTQFRNGDVIIAKITPASRMGKLPK